MIALLAALAVAVPQPSAPGSWRQLGAAPTSRPGKQLHFFRIAMSPTALGVVVSSSSSARIRLTWWSYCEFESDDGMTEQHQATVTGTHLVTVYPPVFAGATMCTVIVNAGAGPRASVSAAVFSS